VRKRATANQVVKWVEVVVEAKVVVAKVVEVVREEKVVEKITNPSDFSKTSKKIGLVKLTRRRVLSLVSQSRLKTLTLTTMTT